MTKHQPDPTRGTGAAPGPHAMTELQAWRWIATISLALLAAAVLLLAAIVGGSAL